jgi:cytochrome P450
MIADNKLEGKTTPAVFREVLNSDLPPEEKSLERLWHDAQTFLIAGAETTGFALANCTYYLLSQPNDFHKLRDELKTAFPDDLSENVHGADLENLPFLVSYL